MPITFEETTQAMINLLQRAVDAEKKVEQLQVENAELKKQLVKEK